MPIDRMDEGQVRVQIAERIRERRKAQNLTQDVLAIRSEISKSFMSEVESGVTSANALVYIRLARALHCSVQYLLTGDPPPRVSQSSEQLERIAGSLDRIEKHFEQLVDHTKGTRSNIAEWLAELVGAVTQVIQKL